MKKIMALILALTITTLSVELVPSAYANENESVEVTVEETTKRMELDPVKNFKVKPKNEALVLSWDIDPEAKEYEIYRKAKTETETKFKLLCTISVNQYVDINIELGKEYEYYIIPIPKDENMHSPYGVDHVSNSAIPRPTLSKVKVNKKYVYAKVKGKLYEGYKIYIGKTKSSLKGLKYVAKKEFKFFQRNIRNKNKGKFYIGVRAYIRNANGSKAFSEMSNIKSFKIK